MSTVQSTNTPNKAGLTEMGSNLDEERIDVCKQNLILEEICTSFNHKNTQIMLSVYQKQYFVFYVQVCSSFNQNCNNDIKTDVCLL